MLKEKLEQMIKEIELMMRDAEKVDEKANKSASVRLRKDLKKLSDSIKEIRKLTIEQRESN